MNFLEKKYRFIMILGAGILTIIIVTLFIYQPDYYKMQINTNELIIQKVTGSTVRIKGKDPFQTAIAISQIVYPATFDDDKPNAVILVRSDKKEDGIAATGLIHHPINGPILFIEKDSIPEITLEEIKRLDPQGVFIDNNVKIYLVGDIGDSVREKLEKEELKYRYITGKNPFELGNSIDSYLAKVHGDHSDIVMVAPIDDPEYGIVQGSWNAHMGDSFLYVNKDSVPKETANSLRNRYGGAYIYILGHKDIVSEELKKELSKYGHVQSIPNMDDIYKQSVGFAGYRDVGKNFGWWINKRNRDFGWGIAEEGHNFIFVNVNNWHNSVSASVLSHKGKHGPILLVKNDEIPEAVVNYLNTVKPLRTSPQEQLFNHGWIIGDYDSISKSVESDISNLLEYEGTE